MDEKFYPIFSARADMHEKLTTIWFRLISKISNRDLLKDDKNYEDFIRLLIGITPYQLGGHSNIAATSYHFANEAVERFCHIPAYRLSHKKDGTSINSMNIFWETATQTLLPYIELHKIEEFKTNKKDVILSYFTMIEKTLDKYEIPKSKRYSKYAKTVISAFFAYKIGCNITIDDNQSPEDIHAMVRRITEKAE